MKKIITGFFILFNLQVFAQATFTSIYNILQTNCAVSGCHAGASPTGSLSLDGSQTAVYNNIVNINPTNATALSKGHKLIEPGYPDRSFLLRKIAHGLSHDLNLLQGEGDPMPQYNTKLPDQDIELVRQWILWAAPQSGTVVNRQTLIDYYTIGGAPKITRPPTPAQGFQIHFGPVFLTPGQELEYFQKFDPGITQNIEINEMDLYMNSESHHYILRKFKDQAAANNVPTGLSPFTISAFSTGKDFLNAWQDDGHVELPPGTGYFWDQNTILDLNYHLRNTSGQIIPAETYLNISAQPRQSGTIEMHAELVPNLAIFIPNNNQTTTIPDVFSLSSNITWNIWMLSSHTHKYGTDYDIYLRNSNGSRGTQLYEGFSNFNHTFNQGYYDWEHPPVRYFYPLYPVNMKNGLIHEAKWVNNGPNSVFWGFTTNEEMMLIYVQYTLDVVPFDPPVYVQGNNPACAPVTLSTDSGFVSYLWSTGETTPVAMANTTGNYHVQVTDIAGNTWYSDTLMITINPSTAQINNGVAPAVCDGQAATLDAGSGNSFVWSTGATTQTVNVFSAGNYEVTVIDANGCQATANTNLTVYPVPVVNLQDAEFCQGGSVELDAGNPTAGFSWSTGETTQKIIVSTSNNYEVTVTDNNGCQAAAVSVITVNPLPEKNLNNITICVGSATTLDAGNPGSGYIWSTGDTGQTLMVSTPDDYSVTVTDVHGCVSADTATLSFGSNLSVNIPDLNICQGESKALDAGFPGSQYIWSTGDSVRTIQVSTAGKYYVTVTDPSGCTGMDSSSATLLALPVADAGNDASICLGESAPLLASGGTGYLWNHGANTAGTQVSPLSDSQYTVTVTDANGCSATDQVLVTVKPLPDVQIGGGYLICNTNEVMLTVSGAVSYLWSNGGTANSITVDQPGEYSVLGTGANGCNGLDTVQVLQSIVLTSDITGKSEVEVAEVADYSIIPTAGSSYNWTLTNGSILSGQGTELVTVRWDIAGLAVISVIETDELSCAGDAKSLEVSVGPVGIHEASNQAKLEIYPNPFSQITKIVFPNPNHENYELRVVNITGKIVRIESRITSGEFLLQRNNLPNGLYLIELRGSHILRGKVIIE